MKKYSKQIILAVSVLVLCITVFLTIRFVYFSSYGIDEPIKNIQEYYNPSKYFNNNKYPINYVTSTVNFAVNDLVDNTFDEEVLYEEKNVQEIMEEKELLGYQGNEMVTENVKNDNFDQKPLIPVNAESAVNPTDYYYISKQFNEYLKGSYLENTGEYFTNYASKTGVDPYLELGIVMLETGCKWKCSSLTRNCNNIGGMKGSSNRCGTSSYSRFNTLEEGINAYLDNIYNNYYLKGLKTPEEMNSKYAASPEWARKVNAYMDEIKRVEVNP